MIKKITKQLCRSLRRVALYLRLSKEDLEKNPEESSESIKNQELMLRKYAEENGWEVVGVYEDEDYSGSDRDRPNFNKMISECEKGNIDIVLVKTQARFARDIELVDKYIHNKFKEGYDIVIGSRYVKGGKTDDYLLSKIMSRTLNLIYRILLNIKPKDISTSFRMYDTKQLKAIQIESNHFEIQEEIIFKMMQNNKNIKIAEVPIYFSKRLYGESKRDMIPFIKAYLKSLRTLIKIRIKSNKKGEI